MQKLIIACFLFFCLMSCSKDGGAADSNSGTGSGKGGSLARFTIANNRLFVVEDYSINVYDITSPRAPVFKKSVYINVSTQLETVFPYNNNLFVGGTDGMFIYDITNPDNPVLKGSALHLRSCDPVVANDSVSYVTLRGGTRCGTANPGLYVYDVKNIMQPSQKKYLQMPTPYGLSLHDTTLYVCLADSGLQVLNVKQAYNPVGIKRITGETFTDVISYNNILIAWVKTGIAVYNIAQPQNPVILGFVAN